MHASVIIALPSDADTGDIDDAVAHQMEPFEMRYSNDAHYSGNTQNEWDWYQVGGRWTGFFDPSYNPNTDPKNIETCKLCNGTGTRTDMVAENGCNGCKGTGKHVKWPTSWARFGGDVMRKSDINFKAIKDHAATLAAKRFDEVSNVIAGRPFKTHQEMNPSGNDAAAREAYWAQPPIKDLQKLDGWVMNPAEFLVPREDYIAKKHDEAISAFAFLKDREWVSQSWSWSWHGPEVHEWNTNFMEQFITPLPDDTILVVVDFHS